MMMLDRLTENFETTFAMPDEDICRQGNYEGEFMFFILKGLCKVQIKNVTGGGRKRNLTESMYFGEIGMFYNCERQATVLSHSYDSFARISK